MPGNSARRGAVRRSGKGSRTAGSGGRRRKGLAGKGPTPKAADREGHVAHKQRARARQTGGSRPRPAGAGDWVTGRNSVLEALRAHVPVSRLYVAAGAQHDGRVREVFKIAADRGISLLEVPRPELDAVTAGSAHQGLAARVPAYDYAHPEDLLDRAARCGEDPLLVALDSITDPHNLGAVVRSAAGFGAHGVVVPARRSAGMTAAAWKASAGAAARLPVARATNLTRQLEAYKASGAMVLGLAARADQALSGLASDLARGPLVLVVGSEGSGLSRLVAQTCDLLVSVPMVGQADSLNAAVAASIALYEIAGHRG